MNKTAIFHIMFIFIVFSGEADILASHVEKLVSMGLKQQDIAVIAPYNLQVKWNQLFCKCYNTQG